MDIGEKVAAIRSLGRIVPEKIGKMLICFKNFKIGFQKNILLKQTFLGKIF